jgi:tetratricopeptide (TPR) repeat protein
MRFGWILLMAAWMVPALYSQGAEPQNAPAPAKQEDLKHRPQPANGAEEEIPPEEDKSLSVTEYSFNPLQAEKELQTGNYYFKKGSYRAAASRFREATKWNDGSIDAWLRLGETEEKLKDHKAAKEAYAKYLTLAADAKNAPEIRKKLGKMK